MLNAAFAAVRVTVPSVTVPFLKVMLPVGTPVVADFTVAVNVTEVPTLDGFLEETTVVVVPALVTVCVNAGDVLALKVVLPP